MPGEVGGVPGVGGVLREAREGYLDDGGLAGIGRVPRVDRVPGSSRVPGGIRVLGGRWLDEPTKIPGRLSTPDVVCLNSTHSNIISLAYYTCSGANEDFTIGEEGL